MKHTIYYDDQCPFCRRWKKRIQKWDKHKAFVFKPQDHRSETMLLVEASGAKRLRAKAILRIFWLLGWYIPGCLYLLPAWLIDPIYRYIASHRK